MQNPHNTLKRLRGLLFSKNLQRLSTQTQRLDEGAVALDVAILQVGKQFATLTNQHGERTCCHVVLVILFEVLGQMRNAIGKQSDLAFDRTSVFCACTTIALQREPYLVG